MADNYNKDRKGNKAINMTDPEKSPNEQLADHGHEGAKTLLAQQKASGMEDKNTDSSYQLSKIKFRSSVVDPFLANELSAKEGGALEFPHAPRLSDKDTGTPAPAKAPVIPTEDESTDKLNRAPAGMETTARTGTTTSAAGTKGATTPAKDSGTTTSKSKSN